jgi:hypothetical protein
MQDAVERLRTQLGASPPTRLVAALDESALAELADALAEARRAQRAALAQAREDALGHIPRLLRPIVRRVVGA